MKVLALDTSTPWTSCALVELEGGTARVLAESLDAPPGKAGDLLPGALVALCARAGLALSDVRGIAAGIGPGSFTGLRVGLAAAKSLAWALRIPLAGVSSLRALAAAAGAGPVAACVEARKGELFVGAWRGDEVLLAECACPVAELPARLSPLGPLSLAGAGAVAWRDALGGFALLDSLLAPPALAVATLAAPALAGAAFDAERCFALAPNYLQPALAEVALAQGKVGGLAPAQASPRRA